MAFGSRFRDFDAAVGAEAASLGGAYSAISEDASGIYYNPAGIAFSKKQGVSPTASSLENNKTVYENGLGDQNLRTTSGGFHSNFIGSTFHLSPYGFSNWYGAIGTYSNGSEISI